MHEDYIPVVCEPRDRKVVPSSDYEAKFGLPFVVASAIINLPIVEKPVNRQSQRVMSAAGAS